MNSLFCNITVKVIPPVKILNAYLTIRYNVFRLLPLCLRKTKSYFFVSVRTSSVQFAAKHVDSLGSVLLEMANIKFHSQVMVKLPYTDLERPQALQEVQAARFQIIDTRRWKYG